MDNILIYTGCDPWSHVSISCVIRALDVDVSRNLVYWTDVTNKAVYRAMVPTNVSDVAFPYSLGISGLKSPEGIAVDWVTRYSN